MRIEENAGIEEVEIISQLSTRKKEENIDQAIKNEVEGEFDFLLELPFKEERCKTLPQQNICNICDKIFKTKYYLREHSRLHTGLTKIF